MSRTERTDSERLAVIEDRVESILHTMESWPRLCAEHRAMCAEQRVEAHTS